MDKAQILEKIQEVEKEQVLFDRAIATCICPECGERLKRFVGEF